MKTCKNCNNNLSSQKRTYCSTNCQNIYQRKEYIIKWKKGEVTGIVGKKVFELSDKIRTYLFEINNNKCSNCGWGEINPTTNKVPLQIDHIDGDWQNCSENNLKLLCPNCHSLTPTYMGLNKGKGRSFRYQSK